MEPTENKTAPENSRKNKTAKFIKRSVRFLAWFGAIAVALLLMLLIFRDTIIKSAVTTLGSWVTGSRVTLEHFETSLTTGEVSIADLRIGNPAGYDRKEMVSLGSLYIRVQLSTLFSDHLLIDDIDINKLVLLGEFKKDGRFNGVEMMDIVKQKLSIPPEEPDEPDTQETSDTPPGVPQEDPPQEVTISRLNIRESSAIVYDDRIGVPVEIPLSYSAENITTIRDNSKPLVEVLYDFAKDMENACNGTANAGELVKDAGKKLVDTTKKQLKDAVDATGKQFSDKISELFSF